MEEGVGVNPTMESNDAKAAIRLVIVEDHPVVRRGISAVLKRRAGIEVVGEAADGDDAVDKIRTLRPDVVLMDVDLPKRSGLQVAEWVKRKNPTTKVVLLTGHSGSEAARRAAGAGVYGFLPKESPVEVLVRAVEEAAAGRRSEFQAGGADIGVNLDKLTTQQRNVLLQIANGLRSEEIAKRLGISERLARAHRATLMRKLGARSVADLTRIAVSAGLVRAEEDPDV